VSFLFSSQTSFEALLLVVQIRRLHSVIVRAFTVQLKKQKSLEELPSWRSAGQPGAAVLTRTVAAVPTRAVRV
jgi:hypothetical protein